MNIGILSLTEHGLVGDYVDGPYPVRQRRVSSLRYS